MISCFFGSVTSLILFVMIAVGHRFHSSTGLVFMLIMTEIAQWANVCLQIYYFARFNLRFDLNKARSRRTIPIVKKLFIFFYLLCIVSLVAIFIAGAVLQRGIFKGIWAITTFYSAIIALVAAFWFIDSIRTIKEVVDVNEETITQKNNALTLLYIYLFPGTCVGASTNITVDLLLVTQVGGYLAFLIHMFFGVSAYSYSLWFALPKRRNGQKSSSGSSKNITS